MGLLAERLQRDWWRPQPGALSRALLPLALLYRLVSSRRRSRASAGALPVPVAVVGNLVVGGAGKTPTVIALVKALRQAGWRPGVVSRGYGRDDDAVRPVTTANTAQEVGDEPLLIHLRTGAPVFVGRDRLAAARALCAAHPQVNVLVSDDGLQHRRLPRQLQILVFDDRGIGNGLLLPAGPLREALPPALPPDTLVVYNAAHASTPLPGCTAIRRLAGAVSLADWWRGEAPLPQALDALRGRTVCAAAGMAHPERFFRMLEAQGLSLHRLPLPDHHPFRRLPWPPDTGDVLVTEKDAIKLHPLAMGDTRVWVVALDLRLPAAFVAEAQRILRSSPQAS